MNTSLTVAVVLVATLQVAVAAGLPDPTRPNFDAGPRPGYRLGSILVSPVRRTAVINGHDVSVGDLVGHARVVSIGDDGVRLIRNGRVVHLRLVGDAGIHRSNIETNGGGGS